MSVLRAILGRFARFLVRIACRLDPDVAAAPYWVVPERMAMLRQRYPGAPEHWLELIARRAPLTEPSDTPAERPQPLDPGIEADRPHRPHAAFETILSARPRPRFFTSLKARTIGRPIVAIAHDRPGTAAPANGPEPAPRESASAAAGEQGRAERSRQEPAFAALFRRNPIANLLRLARGNARPGPASFRLDDRKRAIPDDRSPVEHPLPHRPPESFFPEPPAHGELRIDWPASQERRGGRREWDPRWLSVRRALPDQMWPVRANSPRFEPQFVDSDPRWPDLPPLSDEAEAPPLSAKDEATLLAEQIGGRWNG
jgi:hypothetical protein